VSSENGAGKQKRKEFENEAENEVCGSFPARRRRRRRRRRTRR